MASSGTEQPPVRWHLCLLPSARLEIPLLHRHSPPPHSRTRAVRRRHASPIVGSPPPLDPKPPLIEVAATTAKKVVTIKWNAVRLGIPTDLAKRALLRKKLSTFLRRNVTNLAGAITLLNAHFILSVAKAPAISSSSIDALALPTKYRAETRKRRVTTRLGPGTYVARVTVRLKDAKGRTFSTGRTTAQARFTVR